MNDSKLKSHAAKAQTSCLGIAVVVVMIGISCKSTPEKPSSKSPGSIPSFFAFPRMQPLAEPIWVYARSGDPLELARLANEVGAPKLAQIIANPETHQEDLDTAIRALAFVDEPTIALDVLCSIATHTSGESSTLALQTLSSLVFRKAPIEEHEPTAWTQCGEALLIAKKSIKDEVRRALVVRILTGLIERKALNKQD